MKALSPLPLPLLLLPALAQAGTMHCTLTGDGGNGPKYLEGDFAFADAGMPSARVENQLKQRVVVDGAPGTLVIWLNSRYLAGELPQFDIAAFFYADDDAKHDPSRIEVRTEASPIRNEYRNPPSNPYTHRIWAAGGGSILECKMSL